MNNTKVIWNGKQLPPVGCEVLIHLASWNSWVKHRVDGYKIWPGMTEVKSSFRIFIEVSRLDNGQLIKNSRLLTDVRPVDWQEGDDYNPALEQR